MTSIPANLPHRHVDHETGHILHVDPITGEVIARRSMTRRKNPEAEYQAWADQRRAEDLTTDYITAQAGLVKVGDLPTSSEPEPIKQGRGRPKTIFKNPAVAFMPFLVIPDPLPWVADIIHGSICTSAGTSNGKINVKARAVIGALFLSEISAEACQTSEYTLRTAQRIAKAARHAAHGIASYVERHPKLKAELDATIEAEALFWVSQA
ncbi:hypothetical protein [Pseudomonas alkylphenolica]|uniref:hypothetical protein n=1 Tax=Pseudomonas alkylphenolica TaxID=237609 RepID=UPI0018D65374|nr:hypothetical protein [Pseudomonas alkylphenolica]MBH3426507.1 hypothetical protein [Pseudomonas alkylphenolica]